MKNILGNSDLIKRINVSNIIEILKVKGSKSRAELAALTGLTPASITKLTKKLIELDILTETGQGVISGGRPPILLDINSQGGHIIGIDLSPNKIIGILSDIKGDIVYHTSKILTSKKETDILSALFSLIDEFISYTPKKNIIGIGVALNGMVNYEKGISIFSPHYKWNNLNLKEKLETKFNIPSIIDNDVNAMALGEHKQGVAINEDNVLVLHIGQGIGAGIILNNKLYRGANYSAGEIGHTLIEKNSTHLCSCGKYGCLEALIGKEQVLAKAMKEIPEFSKENNIKDLCALATNGDLKAIKIITEVANILSLPLSSLINNLNPKLIVIIGDIVHAKDVFFKPLNKFIRRQALPTSTENLSILPSKSDVFAGSIGGATLVYVNLFDGEKILKI